MVSSILTSLIKIKPLSGFKESCTELQVRNSFQVPIIFLFAAVIGTAAALYYLVAQSNAWQMFVIAGGGFMLVGAAAGSAWLSRRPSSKPGIMILLGTVEIALIILSALLAEIGLLLGLVTTLAIVAIAVQTLPSKAVTLLSFSGVAVGIVAGILELLAPPSQLAAPGLSTFYLALGSGLLVIYGYRAIRQFHACSLSSKLMLTFLLVALVPLGLLAFANNRATKSALTKEANQVLFGLASETGESIDIFIKTNLDAIQSEAQIPDIVAFLDTSSTQALSSDQIVNSIDLLRALGRKDEVNITSYALLDRRGQVVNDTQILDIGLDKSDRNYFQEALRADEPYVSPVQISHTTGEASLYFSNAVHDGSGEVIGVLRVRYRADILQQLLVQKNGIAGPDSFGVLFDENHIHLAHGNAPQSILTAVAPLEPQLIAELQTARRLPNLPTAELTMNLLDLEQNLSNSAEQPFFTAEDIATGIRRNQVAVTSLETQPWLVAFFQPQDVFLAPIVSQTRTTILLATVLSGLAVIVAVGIGQMLAAPIVELTDVVLQFTSGDFKARAQVKTSDEAGVLATNFNAMAGQMGTLITGLLDQSHILSAEVTERKRAEQALQEANDQLEIRVEERTKKLRESETRFRSVTQSANNAIISADSKGIILSWNKGAHSIFGYREEEILARPLTYLMPQRYRDAHQRGLERANSTGETQLMGETIELQGLRKDGSEFPLELTLSTWQTGKEIFYSGILRDVTERSQAEKELRESEEKYRVILESIEDGYFEVDITGTLTFFNRALSEIFGYPEDELIGMNNREYQDQENARVVYETFNRVYETGQSDKTLAYEIIRKDGTKRHVETSVSLMKDEKGQRIGFRGILRDITARKQAEKAQTESEEKYRSLFEYANDSILITNLETGRYIDVNENAAMRLGYTKEELVGMSFHDINEEVQDVAIIQEMQEKGSIIFESIHQRKDGSKMPVEISSRLIDYGGKQVFQSFVRDITARKRAEEALQQYADRLEGLHAIDRAILAAESPEAIAKGAVDYLRKLVPGKRASVALFDFEADEFSVLTAHVEGKTRVGGGTSAPLETFGGDIDQLRKSEVYMVESIDDLTQLPAVVQTLQAEGMRSYLSIPLFAQGDLIGSLNLGAGTPNTFTPEHVAIAREVADQLAIALRQAQLHAAEREQRALAEALADTASALNSTLNLDEVLHQILTNIERVVPHDAANIMLLEADSKTARVVGRRGYAGRTPDDIVLPERNSIADLPNLALLVEGNEPLAIPDTSNSPDWVYSAATRWVRSYAGVPIRFEGEIIGLLNIHSATQDFFTPAHAQRLLIFADQAAVAIHNAQLFEAERKQRMLVQSLIDSAAALNSTLNLDEVLEHILASVTQVVPNDAADIMLVESDVARIVRSWNVAKGGPEEALLGLRLPVSETANLNEMVNSGLPLAIPDLQAYDPGWVEFPETHWMRSYAGAPIRLDEQVIGFVGLYSGKPNFLQPADAEQLQGFANQAAIAINNARLYESTREHATRLELIAHIGQDTINILALDELLRHTINLISDAFGYYNAHIMLVENDELVFKKTTLQIEKPLEDHLRIRIGEEGISGWVAEHGEALLVPDVSLEPRYYPAHEGTKTASELIVPIKSLEQTIGVLGVQSTELNAFSQDDVAMLQTTADQLAVAIQNAHLYEELASYSQFLEQAVDERTDELHRTKRHVEAVLDSVGEAVVVIGRDGLIQQVNPAFEQQTGYTSREALGRSHQDLLLHEDIPHEIFRESSTAMRAGQGWRGEIPVRRQDNTSYDAAVTITPMRNPDGEPTAFVGSLVDISPLKEVERMKDAFVSNVSHELRTPITSLKLFHNLLSTSPPEEHAQLLTVLRRETNRLNDIVEDVLRLSRLDQGRVDLDFTAVNIDALVEEYINDRMALAASQGLTLRLEKQLSQVTIQADGRLLGQVLSVLLTNAVNYTPAGGEVLVTTQSQELNGVQWVGFSVSDSGPGIAADEQKLLFSRFFRGKVGRATGTPGTGLGLAIAKEIVDQHEGHIEVSSEGVPGKGATFSVWLPIK